MARCALLSISGGRLGQNSGMRSRALVTLTCLVICAVSIRAQIRTDEHMARARTALAVRLLPDLERLPLATLPAGTIVKVIRRDGAWIHIEFRDARYGERTGYVLASGLILDARFVERTDSTGPSSHLVLERRDPSPLWSESVVLYRSFTELEIGQAVDAGLRARGAIHGLVLPDSGDHSYPTMGILWRSATPGTRLRVHVYTSLAWVRQLASDAARDQRAFSIADVDAEALEPVVRVVAYPDLDYARRTGAATVPAVQQIVLRDESWRTVIQPSVKTPIVSEGQTAGESPTRDGLRVKFPLAGVNDVRGPRGDREFFVTISLSGGEEKSFRVTREQFGGLP
jgi:hypothetical protein